MAALLAGSMWFYFLRILVPYERADAAEHDRPRGNLSDLYPRWLGARELLLNRRNPYSAEVTREIQKGYFGRELDPNRPGDPRDQQAFAYPLYVVFLIAPTVKLPFEEVRRGFRWILAALTVASVWMWLRALRWKPSCTTTAVILILSLSNFGAIQGLRLQQLSLLVAALIAGAVLLLARGHLFLGGMVLAVATTKPQLVAPLLACLLLWTLGNWRTRRKLIWGFASTMALLLVGAELLLPGWIGSFLNALRDYRQYTGGLSSLDVLLSPSVGRLVALAVLLALAWICWRFRRVEAESPDFVLLVALTLGATLIVIPTFASYNQVLLLPAVFALTREGKWLWQRGSWSRAVCMLGIGLLAWPWVAAVGLSVASFVVAPQTVQQGWKMPLATIPAIPFACLMLLAPLVGRRLSHPA